MAEWGELKNAPPDDGAPKPKRDPNHINCLHCVHYKVTWDPAHPRGCKIFEFSGAEMPSVTVFNTTGQKCPAFREKPKPGPG